ncbi:MAG: Smr/MutS family protein [Lentisphaeria bacterium]|nr:Smr/MutS family protein [Lentisphaeria bacterium]
MDAHALKVLEFQAALDIIAGHAHSAPGGDWVRALMPRVQLRDIIRNHPVLKELRGLVDTGVSLPAAHFADPAAIFNRVRPHGAVLGGDELLVCRDFIQALAELRDFLSREECRGCQALLTVKDVLIVPDELVHRLRRSLDADGSLLDDASPKLAELRRNVRKLEESNQRLLERLLKDEALSGVYQDHFVTLRNGRYVLPVRREAKGQFKGVIHDLSDSGRTVFMEPEQSVAIGNELASTRLEERDECRRIYADLSAGVRQRLPELEPAAAAAARLDGLSAVTRWSSIVGGMLPRFTGRVKLVSARHPLLDWRFRQAGRAEDLVPLTVSLPEETRALVVTGSNSGGKTVTLKTFGLMSLLAQSGLPIPAGENSELDIFDAVFADIGDEQSLTENLSTFTGHLTRMKEILAGLSRGRALVLLDELGTGTDPLEGGAIGCALLAEFARRDALTVATTHLGAIKSFAEEQPGMLNGAVRFNLETLAPEYVLEIGRPGASHALRIARRIGLPDRVLDQAEKQLDKDHVRMENLLVDLEDRERRTAEDEKQARAALARIRRDRDDLRKQLADLQRDRNEKLHEAYREAEHIVAETRRKMEHLIAGLSAQDDPDAALAKENRQAARALLAESLRTLSYGKMATAARPARPIAPDDLREGMRVWVRSLNAEGAIRSFSRGGRNVTVTIKGMAFTVMSDQLERVVEDPDRPGRKVKKSGGGVSLPKARGNTCLEINLLGKRVDEACDALDRFIDQARLSNLLEVRVVHGFGSGRLMKGLHGWLNDHGFRGKFRLADADKKEPGGGGVTIVQID